MAAPKLDPGYRRDPRDLRSPPQKLDAAGLEAGLAHVRSQLPRILVALREEESELGCLEARVLHQAEAVRRRRNERDYLRNREEDLLIEQCRRQEEKNA